MIPALLAYLLIINVIAFAVCGHDKKVAARGKGKRRVPEKVLFLLCFLGGSLGMWLGMYFFRHKTRHWYFVLCVPLILVLQIAAIVYFQLI